MSRGKSNIGQDWSENMLPGEKLRFKWSSAFALIFSGKTRNFNFAWWSDIQEMIKLKEDINSAKDILQNENFVKNLK